MLEWIAILVKMIFLGGYALGTLTGLSARPAIELLARKAHDFWRTCG